MMKERARSCKLADKNASEINSKLSTWTVDAHAVLSCPKPNASSMYYKTKLQVHNLTFYKLNTHDGFCYVHVWDEMNGGLTSDVFAWLYFTHFKEYLQENPTVETLIMCSDGRGYKNRNATLSNASLELARLTNVTIIQKCLISGHTQMKCDSTHSCIERRIKGPIYCLRDCVLIMQSARLNPRLYKVREIQFSDFQT